MIKIGSLELLRAVYCEDVRQEITGKYVLIGVFPGDIAVHSFPASVAMCLYFDFAPLPVGSRDLHLKISGKGIEVKMRAEINVSDPGQPITIVTPSLGIEIQESGKFTLCASDDGEEWIEIFEKDVRQGAVNVIGGGAPPTVESPDDKR